MKKIARGVILKNQALPAARAQAKILFWKRRPDRAVFCFHLAGGDVLEGGRAHKLNLRPAFI